MTIAPVRRIALLWLAAVLLLPATPSLACEKHPKGHQNSSESETDYSRSR